jgi:hypothetical protein
MPNDGDPKVARHPFGAQVGDVRPGVPAIGPPV